MCGVRCDNTVEEIDTGVVDLRDHQIVDGGNVTAIGEGKDGDIVSLGISCQDTSLCCRKNMI